MISMKKAAKKVAKKAGKKAAAVPAFLMKGKKC